MNKSRASFFIIALPLAIMAVTFATMPAEEYMGDAHAVRAEAIILLNTGQWAIPRDIAITFGEPGQYFFRNPQGAYYPKYGVMNTVMYLPALGLEKIATANLKLDSRARAFFLDLIQVGLSGVTACYLVLVARRFTRAQGIVALFVLGSLFATFWWNYLRAQTFEIYHVLFFLAFYYHFVRAFDRTPPERLHLLGAALYLGALCLCKTVYVILGPVVAAVLLNNWGTSVREERTKILLRSVFFFALPLSLALGLLLGTNRARFGSPFATGYTQWAQETQLFSPANLPSALRGFLLDPHLSVFLHFPLFLFALVRWPAFFQRHKFEARLILLFSFVLLMTNSMFKNWSGESCYGPRYLLPILPLLSLPFISYLEWLGTFAQKFTRLLLRGATALLLTYFCILQLCVNTLPFFFCYYLRDLLDDRSAQVQMHYLLSHSFGTISCDYLRHRAGQVSSLTEDFYHQLNRDETERFSNLSKSLTANYYWFPHLLRPDALKPGTSN